MHGGAFGGAKHHQIASFSLSASYSRALDLVGGKSWNTLSFLFLTSPRTRVVVSLRAHGQNRLRQHTRQSKYISCLFWSEWREKALLMIDGGGYLIWDVACGMWGGGWQGRVGRTGGNDYRKSRFRNESPSKITISSQPVKLFT